jgi:mannan endo-1,4-beta-mannosidase
LTDTQRLGRHRQAPRKGFRSPRRGRPTRLATITAAALAVAIIVAFTVHGLYRPTKAAPPPAHDGLPTATGSYIGLYAHGVPGTYAGVNTFTAATGIKPHLVLYYSGWLEPFQASFARTAANAGAVPLVQINPTGVNIAAIASGSYDGYLSTYAKAIRAYGRPVILGFGHEMNGSWYTWGYSHTSPAVFVAAWRHIVTLFRALGTQNVTWLWTINTIQGRPKVPAAGPWWPGSSFVTWVGIDGYYTDPSSVFASIFGSTITDVRALTRKPILIAETAATAAAGQPDKIAGLFEGVHLYGLLGFVWFNSVHTVDWRLSGPAALTAMRRGAQKYIRTAP